MFDSNNNPDRNEMRLAEHARREAERVSPLFSEALHLRVMRAVDSTEHTPHLRERRQVSIAPLLGLAAALAVLILPTVFDRLNPVKPLAKIPTPARQVLVSSSDSEIPVFAINRAAHQVNARVQDVVQTAMVEQQWVGLDHDVRLAARYLVDQVPLKSAWATDTASR